MGKPPRQSGGDGHEESPETGGGEEPFPQEYVPVQLYPDGADHSGSSDLLPAEDGTVKKHPGSGGRPGQKLFLGGEEQPDGLRDAPGFRHGDLRQPRAGGPAGGGEGADAEDLLPQDREYPGDGKGEPLRSDRRAHCIPQLLGGSRGIRGGGGRVVSAGHGCRREGGLYGSLHGRRLRPAGDHHLQEMR